MKVAKVFRWTLLVLCLNSTILISQATAGIYLSNLADSSWGGYGVSGNWGQGQMFQTGSSPGGYALGSISLSMISWYEGVSDFQVSIYSNSGGKPGIRLETLSGSNDPQASGLYDYTSSGITLSSGTPYWIVGTASGAATGFSAYFWEITRDAGYVSSDGWQIPAGNTHGVYNVASGAWALLDPGTYGTMEFAVHATPVPEPGSWVLTALGLWFLWRKPCLRRECIKAED